MIRFNSTQISISAAAAEGEESRREIMGIAVPYGVPATVSDGTDVIFEPGSLPVDGKAPRLFMNHDSTQAIGIVTERAETPEGMMFTAKLSKVPQADTALTLALDGVLDSVSVGVNVTKSKFDKDGTMRVLAADWVELSMVPVPAFAGAIITDVAASIHQEPEEISNTEIEEPIEETQTMSEVAAPAEVVEATTPTTPIFAQAKREFALPTPGEYLAAMHIGGDTFRKVNEAYKISAAKNQTSLQFAAQQDLTTDTVGLLSNIVLGPVFQNYNFIRPVVSALGARAMPASPQKTFIRPSITQHTVSASQSEGQAVTSQKMTLQANSITKTTVAGTVFISQQDMDFTSPEAMNVIVNDLAGSYLKETDNIIADSMNTYKTSSGYTWTVTTGDPTSLMNALYGAAYNISLTSNLFPTHLFVSVDVWQKLGSQLDADKRPLFPAIGAPGLLGTNTLGAGTATSWSGMNPLGLQIVVDGNFAAGTMLVAHAPACEVYEEVRGIMSLDDPNLLGRQFTYYGYIASYFQGSTIGSAPSPFIQSVVIA